MTPAPLAHADEVRSFILCELVRDEALDLGEDEPLFSSGLLDSFSVTPLMVYLEDRFEIRIPAAEVTLADFDTLAKILRLVERRRSALKP